MRWRGHSLMRWLAISSLCISLFGSLFFSCTGDRGNPVHDFGLPAKGSDFLSVSTGETHQVKVSAVITHFDSVGTVTEFSQISDEIFGGTFGPSTTLKNTTAHPFYGFDPSHATSTFFGYIAHHNDEVLGFVNNLEHETVMILPADLKVGREWILNPNHPLKKQYKATLVESLSRYTNSAGRSYINTINVSLTYNDTIEVIESTQLSYYFQYQIISAQVNVYVAKGVGIVGVTLNKFEWSMRFFQTFTWQDSTIKYQFYQKIIATGTAGVMN